MKKHILFSIAALIAILASGPAKAQMDTHWEVQWNISMPAADFENYINETSIRGIEFGGYYHFETNVMLGGSAGYSAFFKKTDRMTVNYDNNTVTAVQFRDLYSWVFMAEAGYAYQSDFFMTPFVRLGLGAYYTEQLTQIGLLYWKDESWDFGLRPEIGALLAVPNTGIGFVINAKYNTAINYGNNLENLNYFTFGAGFVFGM